MLLQSEVLCRAANLEKTSFGWQLCYALKAKGEEKRKQPRGKDGQERQQEIVVPVGVVGMMRIGRAAVARRRG